MAGESKLNFGKVLFRVREGRERIGSFSYLFSNKHYDKYNHFSLVRVVVVRKYS